MVIIAKDEVKEPLYVIVPYFNPTQLKVRVKHMERAVKHFIDSGAVVYLVEVAFNRRASVFADSGLDGSMANCGIIGTDAKFRHKHILLRSKDELWLKENAINVGATYLPYDWEQVMWADGDVTFVRPNWVGQTIHKLQHGMSSGKAFLQPFSHARDVGPNYELLSHEYPHADGVGFAHAWATGSIKSTLTPEIEADLKKIGEDIDLLKKDFTKLMQDVDGNPYYGLGDKRVFPGLAWAATRKAWDAVGGLLDVAIWGGGDWHMSHALIEKTEGMMLPGLNRNYKKAVNQWYQRCRTEIRKNVLVLDGTILHHWHGKKVQRGYNAKHKY